MSRVQFYSCLKLIAAYQASVPLRQELIASTIALPLPKFSWTSSPTQSIDSRTEQQLNGRNGGIDDSQWRKSLRSPTFSNVGNSDVPSTDSEVEHTDDVDGKEKRTVSK